MNENVNIEIQKHPTRFSPFQTALHGFFLSHLGLVIIKTIPHQTLFQDCDMYDPYLILENSTTIISIFH